MIIDKIIFASAKNMPQQVLQNKEDIAKLLSELKDIYNIQQDLTTTTTSVALADTDIPSGVTGGFLLSRNGYFYKIEAINSGVVYLTYYAEFEGATGNGIASISLLSTAGLVDTYRITFTDGTHFDYNVTNGQDGTDGADGATGATGNGIASVSLLSTAGLVDTYRILFTDGTHFDYNVTNGQDGATGATGNGIASVSLLSTAGLVDTYRILFTDGTHFDYNVTNGQDGVGTEIYVNGSAVSSVSFNSDPQTQINNKVDKVSTATRVYATDLGGNQTTLEYSANADANKLVQRYSGGQILVPTTPTSSNHATSKDYVDTALSNKADKDLSNVTYPTYNRNDTAQTGSGDRVVEMKVSTSGNTGYRIWASGFKEMWGVATTSSNTGDYTTTIALPTTFNYTNYSLLISSGRTDNTSSYRSTMPNYFYKIQNQFKAGWYSGSGGVAIEFSWFAYGY